MTRGWYGRAFLIALVFGWTAYMLYPSYFYFTGATQEQRDSSDKFCAALPTWLSCNKFNLGLDLQGGVHLVMGVQTDKAVEQRLDRIADGIKENLAEKKLEIERALRPRGTTDIEVVAKNEADLDAIEKVLKKDYSLLKPVSTDGARLVLTLDEEETQYVRDSAVEQAIKTIRNRADKLGVTEPTIAKRGRDNVLIQLPGVKDPERAIDIIGQTAQLAFHIVDEAATHVFDDIPAEELPEGVERRENTVDGPTGAEREVYFEVPDRHVQAFVATLQTQISEERLVALEALQETTAGPPKTWRTYVLHARPGLTGDYLTDASAQQDATIPSKWDVSMSFDPKGAKLFEQLTADNVRRRMAIVLDSKVNSAPVIREKIGGGSARIELGSARDARSAFQEAKDLALVLKAGALPAPVEVREKRQVGKTLGADSVEAGKRAFVIGMLLIMVFMAVWYRASGLVANLALVLNVFLILAVLALFEATLTLPGMAGILLVMGMAIDANVIIYERIREEMRVGKTPRAAIDTGYAKAWTTIFDSNVTTLIAGVVLMQYGSGPVRGFAVTLIVGILASMFTAIFVTRWVFDFFTNRFRIARLSI